MKVLFRTMCLCCVVFLLGCKRPETKTFVLGEMYEFTLGKHVVRAMQIDDFVGESYLLVGLAYLGIPVVTVHLSAIPMDEVDKLRQQYGNFRRCSNPAARRAMGAAQNISLWPRDPSAASQMEEIVRVSKKLPANPVVRLELAPLHIESIDGQTPERWGNAVERPYVFRSAAITNPDLKLD